MALLFRRVLFLLASAASATDWAIGIYLSKAGGNPAGGYLYPATLLMFVDSFLRFHPSARLAFVADDVTAGHLQGLCSRSVSAQCMIIGYDEVVDKGSLFVRKATVYGQRHHINRGVMRILDELGLWDDASLVLLADTRDVLFQDDLFARLKARTDALEEGEQPLYFAMEPEIATIRMSIRDQAWNRVAFKQCVPQVVFDRLADMPISCSGTTVGTRASILAYVEAMIPFTLFCSGHGRLHPDYVGGMDQPAHMLLLYGTILSRKNEPLWSERYGFLVRDSGGAGYPFHPNPDEPAYRELHALSTAWMSGATRVIPLPLYPSGAEVCTIGTLFGRFATVPVRGEPYSYLDSGTPCAVVHQYDRHDSLTSFFAESFGFETFPWNSPGPSIS
jgi:hypothetical protein